MCPGRSLVPLTLLLAGIPAAAQEVVDSLQLEPVTISAPRNVAFDAGVKTQSIDSATLARSQAADLGELLRIASPIFIKSYGLGSLATTSFRGGSASHTAVLWNGFNLGSPMNGQLDLSLVPVGVADEVSLQYGGAGALWGSGAVGGAVMLGSRPIFGQGLAVEAGASFGSFSDLRQQARVGFSNEKWSIGLRGYHLEAKNDFPYAFKRSGAEEQRRQTNAQEDQGGLLAEVARRINARQQLSLNAWLTGTERQVPPILLQDVGTDHQHDRALRTTAEWRRTGDKVTSFVRAAWFNEELWWYGSGADSAAYSRSRTLVTEGEMRFRRGESHLFGIGVHGTFAEAVADGYSAGRRQDRAALFASYRFRPRGGRFTGTASIRQEMADGSPVPFTWSAGGEYRLRPALTAKTNVSRLFRLPTLNDLYWTPGGDPDLLPESGYGGELGVALKYGSGERFGVEAELTTYQRTMDNWIIWLPAGSYWSPQNLMQVWSRGIEFRGEATGRVGQVQVTVGVMTNYTVSTNERAKSANDASVDKQLIYVPMYSGHARLGLAYKELSITGLTSYTGYRYTSTDNRSYLEPYWLSNAWLAYRLRPMKRYTVSLQAQCNNIFAAEYQVMLNRPMPLRSYQLGISVRFRGTPTQTS